MKNISADLVDFIERHQRQDVAPEQKVLAECDIAYSRWFLGLSPFADDAAFLQFVELLASRELAGTHRAGALPVNVHTTAYALGTLNLVSDQYSSKISELLGALDWAWQDLIDPATLLPRWPWKFTHHAWRVSHWIGGTASIVASLWRLAPDVAEKIGLPQTDEVLSACDTLINAKTGLFRTYRSEVIQFVFRNLYRLRHDPDAGEVGGIVHLHWVNYATGRLPYKAAEALWDRGWALMLKEPFMEAVPYCLDFDVVQIVRTADANKTMRAEVRERADKYARDVVDFLGSPLDSRYTLHKLPGALATLHECAMISQSPLVAGLDIAPRDVMKSAYWI